MKKIFMTLVAVALTVSSNAQWYVGGTVGIANTKNSTVDNKTTFNIQPEIGYNINTEWGVGVILGYHKGYCSLMNGDQYATDDTETKVFTVAPYARYKFINIKGVTIFADLGIIYSNYKDYGNAFIVGISPGASFNLTKHISFLTRIGFLGYQSFSPKGDGKTSSAWGADFNGNNVKFGIYYNFYFS